MGAAGRGAPDQQGNVEAAPLHLGGDEGHFVQRRRDQARQADDVDLVLDGGVKDAIGRDHDAQVDDLVVVALKHHADDVLADIVHVALDRGHQDLACGLPLLTCLFGFHEGLQVGDGLLHHPRRLHHLRQEHPARPEQVADHVHAVHQGAFDDVQRPFGSLTGLLGVLDDEVGDAVDEGMFDAFGDRRLTPRQVHHLGRALLALVAGRHVHQPFGVGHVGPLGPVQDHVLDRFTQFGVDVVIDGQVPSIDDAHVHAGSNGVIQEHRVDRLAHGLVATERERDVGDAARDAGVGQGLLDDAGGLDEVHGVVVVLLDAGGHGEDVRVEDDVLGRETDLIDQDVVGAGADLDLARGGVGLAHLVKGHDHHGGAVAQALDGMVAEGVFALLHADRVDDRLALNALQARLDHLPLGAVDHDRHAGDVGLGRDQVEEGPHGGGAIQQPFVHVDVDDLGARLDLLARDRQGGGIVARDDQFLELGRAGDVGPLADIDEDRAHHDTNSNGSSPDSRRATGRADQGVGDAAQFGDVRPHQLGAQCAVEADGERLGVADRVPEGFRCLAAQRPARAVGDGARDPQRQGLQPLVLKILDGLDRGLAVQGVEHRLDQEDVDAPVVQRARLLLVGLIDLVIGDGAIAGVVDVGAQRQGAVGRADGAGDEAGLVRLLFRPAVGDFARDTGAFIVEVIDRLFQTVIRLGDGRRGEGVGLRNIGPGGVVDVVQISHDVGPRQDQQVVVALLRMVVVAETLAAEIFFRQIAALDHHAPTAVQHQNALFRRRVQGGDPFGAVQGRSHLRNSLGFTHAQHPTDRIDQLGPVQGVEVEVRKALFLQAGAGLGGDGGGQQLARLRVVVQPVEVASQPVGQGRAARRRHPLQARKVGHRHDAGDQGNGHPRRPHPVAETQEGLDVEEELGHGARGAGVDLGLQHLDVVVDGRAFRVLFRIGADRDLKPADAGDGGGQFGGVGVAVCARRIGAADARRTGRVAAQGDDVIDADGLISFDDFIDLVAAGLDAGQVGGGAQGRVTDDALDGAVGSASGPSRCPDRPRAQTGRTRLRVPPPPPRRSRRHRGCASGPTGARSARNNGRRRWRAPCAPRPDGDGRPRPRRRPAGPARCRSTAATGRRATGGRRHARRRGIARSDRRRPSASDGARHAAGSGPEPATAPSPTALPQPAGTGRAGGSVRRRRAGLQQSGQRSVS
uniref:EF-hand domain-containing protein n=1 Tax=Parastrongyloides trichosuri TaxID=131310 RepID=A0A0N4ZXP4_PARTI